MANPTVLARFAELEAQGLARIVAKEEQEPHDASYIDTWGESPEETARLKRETYETIEREGLWFYVSQIKRLGRWEDVDSIGDVIGELDASGYGEDLRAAAVKAFDDVSRFHGPNVKPSVSDPSLG